MYVKEKIYSDTVEIVKNAVTSNVISDLHVTISDFIKEVYNTLKEINEDTSKK